MLGVWSFLLAGVLVAAAVYLLIVLLIPSDGVAVDAVDRDAVVDAAAVCAGVAVALYVALLRLHLLLRLLVLLLGVGVLLLSLMVCVVVVVGVVVGCCCRRWYRTLVLCLWRMCSGM